MTPETARSTRPFRRAVVAVGGLCAALLAAPVAADAIPACG